MGRAFDWVDAFTDTPFCGNACAVVHDADTIPTEKRIALVRETSLSECAYLVSSQTADFGVRYYLADREILMAGHPTIATVQSLLDRGMVKPGGTFTLEVGAGILPIRVSETGLITMRQARPEFGPTCDLALTAKVGSIPEDAIIAPPQMVSTGPSFGITLLRDAAALQSLQLNTEALTEWRELYGMTEPFWVTLTDTGTFSRLLLPPPMPAEDPFTGSATGCMAACLFAMGKIGAKFTAKQGHWMGRPGQAEVQLLGSPDAIEGVEVSGKGVVLMRGELTV
jgi:PhzF family phenazine biosynthesis protein